MFSVGPSRISALRAATYGRRWMSVRPAQKEGAAEPTARKKMTIQGLNRLRRNGTPITMLTAYDFPTAKACDTNGIDITLVGDSLAQVCLGYDSTLDITLDEMIHHVKAVKRGTKHPFLVADMPFGSYGITKAEALKNAVRMVKEGGAEAVKLEGGFEILDTVRSLTDIGIPVMAHVGLLPQRHVAMSGYKVQGRGADAAHEMVRTALALQEAGAFSMVLEAIPAVLGEHITNKLRIPTIGIGAGAGTSGQVLVWCDIMGTWHGHKAKFVRRFANVHGEAAKGVLDYAAAVRSGSFPDSKVEGYEMDGEEWKRFLELEAKSG